MELTQNNLQAQFHNSLIRNFGAPRINYLDQLQSTDLQVCRTSCVTPVMFNQFKNLIAVQTQLTKEQKNILKAICILAYRTGLRLNEILGLKLSDLAMINLRYETIGHDLYYYFTNEKYEIFKIFIHNNYSRQLKTSNAKRGMYLDELLTRDELISVIHLINKKMKVPINQNTLGAKDCLIFSEEGGGELIIKVSLLQRNLSEANKWIEHLKVKYTSNSPEYMHLKAISLGLDAKYLEARELLECLNEKKPRQIKIIKQLIQVCEQLRDHNSVVGYLKLALRIKPNDISLLEKRDFYEKISLM